jgi:hypothetical protein
MDGDNKFIFFLEIMWQNYFFLKIENIKIVIVFVFKNRQNRFVPQTTHGLRNKKNKMEYLRWNTENVKNPAIASDGIVYFLGETEELSLRGVSIIYRKFYNTYDYQPAEDAIPRLLEPVNNQTSSGAGGGGKSVLVKLDGGDTSMILTRDRKEFMGFFLLTYFLDQQIYTGQLTPFIPTLFDAFSSAESPPSLSKGSSRSAGLDTEGVSDMWWDAIALLGNDVPITAQNPLYCLVIPSLGTSLADLLHKIETKESKGWDLRQCFEIIFQLLQMCCAFRSIHFLHGDISLDTISVRVHEPSERKKSSKTRLFVQIYDNDDGGVQKMHWRESEPWMDISVHHFSHAQQFLLKSHQILHLKYFTEKTDFYFSHSAPLQHHRPVLQSPESLLLTKFLHPAPLSLDSEQRMRDIFASEVYAVAQIILSVLTQSDLTIHLDSQPTLKLTNVSRGSPMDSTVLEKQMSMLQKFNVPYSVRKAWLDWPFTDLTLRSVALSTLLYGAPRGNALKLYQKFVQSDAVLYSLLGPALALDAETMALMTVLETDLVTAITSVVSVSPSRTVNGYYHNFWSQYWMHINGIKQFWASLQTLGSTGLQPRHGSTDADQKEEQEDEEEEEEEEEEEKKIGKRKDKKENVGPEKKRISDMERKLLEYKNHLVGLKENLTMLITFLSMEKSSFSVLGTVERTVIRIDSFMEQLERSIPEHKAAMNNLRKFFVAVQKLDKQKEGYVFVYLRGAWTNESMDAIESSNALEAKKEDKKRLQALKTKKKNLIAALELLKRAVDWDYSKRPLVLELLLGFTELYTPSYTPISLETYNSSVAQAATTTTAAVAMTKDGVMIEKWITNLSKQNMAPRALSPPIAPPLSSLPPSLRLLQPKRSITILDPEDPMNTTKRKRIESNLLLSRIGWKISGNNIDVSALLESGSSMESHPQHHEQQEDVEEEKNATGVICVNPGCHNLALYHRPSEELDFKLSFCSNACSQLHWLLYRSNCISCQFFTKVNDQ